MTSFLAALRSLAATCEFPDVEDMIRDRLVIGARDQAIQQPDLQRELRQSKLTLQETINIAISEEASTRDHQSMAGACSEELQQSTNVFLAFLNRARSRHLHLNPDKFRFKVS